MGWDGMGWDGMGWDRMGWGEMGWGEMGWGGVGWGRGGETGRVSMGKSEAALLFRSFALLSHLYHRRALSKHHLSTGNKLSRAGKELERRSPALAALFGGRVLRLVLLPNGVARGRRRGARTLCRGRRRVSLAENKIAQHGSAHALGGATPVKYKVAESGGGRGGRWARRKKAVRNERRRGLSLKSTG